jgi:molecular chaperone DnaJ
VSTVPDHYRVLGVRRDASAADLREAYRRTARAAHPDRHGASSSDRMAQVNEAWRVLGDPARRRQYDLSLGEAGEPQRPAPQPSRAADPPIVAQLPPARFPWRFLLSMAGVGIAVVLIGAALTEPGDPAQPDGLLRPGDCVVVGLDAAEVPCTGPYDAVVRSLVPFDQKCPADTQPYRDRQGMGIACVVVEG